MLKAPLAMATRMRRFLLLTLFCLFLNNTAHAQKFSGQVYVLAESFLDDRCEVLIESGDCFTDLIFLSEKSFAMVTRCLTNYTYYLGNYEKKKDALHFTFKPVMISEMYDAATDKKKYEKKRLKIEPMDFYLTVCDVGKVTIGSTTVKDYRYGSRISGKTAREKITKLKISRSWKMITG